MTKSLSDSLGMKSLEEILAETEVDDDVEETAEATLPAVIPEEGSALISHQDMRGDDHAEAMDEIYDEALETARRITDLGMNFDPARAPRILEVAGQFFKTALDAKNSKRDAHLKLMKLIQDQKKLDLEERRLNGELGKSAIQGEVVFEGDRNELLKMLRAQREKDEDSK